MEIIPEKICTITKYSHFVSITNIQPKVFNYITEFCLNYVIRTMVRVDPKRPPVLKITTIFASRLKNSSEYRLHIGQLNPLLTFLKNKYININHIELIEKKLYDPISIDIKMRDHWILKEEQKEAEEFILKPELLDNRSRLLTMPTGTGKAQPLDAPIKIPGGWTTMGDVKLGDTITAWDGEPTVVNGDFPQGLKDIYRITFSDGRTAECCEEHLWKIYRNFWRGEKWKVVDTKELLRIKEFTTDRVYIPLIKPEQGVDIELPFDPYLLGIILGNGGLSNRSLKFSTQDKFLIFYIVQSLPDNLWIKKENDYDYVIYQPKSKRNGHDYILKLRELGLMGLRSYEKFIPSIYFKGSLSQRLNILRGLLDTDGTVNKNGTISFCSTSLELAKGVQELVRSIGGIAKISTRNPKFTYKGELKSGRVAYQVNIRHSKPSELFKLPRKKNRTNDFNQYSSSLRLRVNKIEKIGKKESKCISIDHPDKLYVTNDYVVTHNTLTSLSAASKFKNRILVVVLAKYLDKWVSDVKGILDIESKDIVTIQGSDNLKSVINLAKDNEFNYKCTIISLTTIVNFIKQFENNYYGLLEEYGCEPHELYELLNIGVVIFDEAHEHLYSIFKTLSFANVPKVIALSATFLSRDPIIDKMQHVMFPKEKRFDKIKMKKYIKVHAVSYSFKNFTQAKIRTSEFRSSTYSHTAFEKSVMKNYSVLSNYLKMIKDVVYMAYVKDYRQGDKLLIFASTIKFCQKLRDYLTKAIPEYDIRTYVEKDPYENIMEADITVSTLLSSGTALDIPNLRTCILTVSIDSPTSNLQALGRLRELKDRDVRYYYLYCRDIKKQMKYHYSRKELIKERVVSISDVFYPISL